MRKLIKWLKRVLHIPPSSGDVGDAMTDALHEAGRAEESNYNHKSDNEAVTEKRELRS